MCWTGHSPVLTIKLSYVCSCGCGERQHRLRRYLCFFLTSRSCHARAGTRSYRGSDQCAFTPACQTTNQCPGRGTTTDLGQIAFGVALPFSMESCSRERNSLAIHLNRGEPQAQLSGIMQPPAGLGMRDFAVRG